MRLLKTVVVGMLIFIAFTFSAKNASALVVIDFIKGPGMGYAKWFQVQGPNEVQFEFPFNTVDFWVNIKDPHGNTVDYDLNKGRIINLNHHGTYTLTVYAKTAGMGLFYAGFKTADTGWREERGENRTAMCYTPGANVRTNNGYAYGYFAKPGDSCKWMIVDNTGQVQIFFGWPKNSPVSAADFHVKIEGEKGYSTGMTGPGTPGGTNIKTLGDWSLNSGTIPSILKGGGVFYVTIYSASGRGDWACMFYPPGKRPGEEKPSGEDHHKKESVEDHHHGSNNIVGTWVTTLGGGVVYTYVFYPNGTWNFSARGSSSKSHKAIDHSGTYKIVGNKIIFVSLRMSYDYEGKYITENTNTTTETTFKIEGNKLILTGSEGSVTYTRK